MRKHQQQLILDTIRTIEQAQSNKQYADCQAGSQAAGSFIEKIKGMGTRTVALLEEYCELLFKASAGEIKEKQLRKHLIKIENSVLDELKPDQIEVLFLIYKASMSDSLASIYLAAKDDPACDAFWMPIPFFAVNVDGSLGTMYYEGAEYYDENITCTNWQIYDIEARRPDIIFIHYAYDNNVSNASIHPAFYSERLREHCGLLVYVPYFVTPDNAVEDYCAYLPGVLYAHHVIVESEAVRKSYIGHYKNFDNAYNRKGQFGKAEEKFVALGSPKFDRVLNTGREDYELPAEWSRLIHNPDGSRKKIIFYNTHMFAWIKGGVEYFEKLRSVFKFFSSRYDIVLLWRPHPNTRLNIEIKRPEWLDAYNEIVNNYKSGCWGIYDDTPDMHRAISWSDAYLGDWSSLVPMFSVTGKPIMIQNMNVISAETRKDILQFEFCYDDGEHIWFAARWFNGLFKCNKKTWAAEYMGFFPGEKRDGQRLFLSVTECGGKLYFAPMEAEQIAAYDMDSGEFYRIELMEVDAKTYPGYSKRGKFLYSTLVGDCVYLFPLMYPAIVKIDSKTHKIEYINDWVDKARQLCGNEAWLFGIAVDAFNGEILVPFLQTDAILTLDCDTSTTQIIPLQTGNIGYVSICFDGNDFWLSRNCRKGAVADIVKWNRESGVIENIDLSEYGSMSFNHEGPANGFINLFFKNGKVYAMPHFCDTAFCIDIATNSVEVIDLFSREFTGKELSDAIHYANPCYWMHEDTIYGLGMKSGIIYSCDTSGQSQCETEISVNLSEVCREIIIKKADLCSNLDDCFYRDTDFHGIDSFIDMITRGRLTDEVCKKQAQLAGEVYMTNGGESGKNIYEYCKSLMLK